MSELEKILRHIPGVKTEPTSPKPRNLDDIAKVIREPDDHRTAYSSKGEEPASQKPDPTKGQRQNSAGG